MARVRVRREKKIRTLANIMRRDNERQERKERGLPPEILELIMSRLNLLENIRASAVSTRWLASAVSVRRTKPNPFLVHIPKRGDYFEFFDPSASISYLNEIPEIRNSRVLYSNDGWLLLNHPFTLTLFFFSPFERATQPIPRPWATRSMPLSTAFTSNPFSTGLIVFTISQTILNVTIAFWRRGWEQWKIITFPRPLHHFYSAWVQIVYSSGCFYCLSLQGQLGVFDPVTFAWSVRNIVPPVCLGVQVLGNPWRARFMAELAGQIYVVCTGPGPVPVVYRVGWENGKEWLPLGGSLEGVALFVNGLRSLAKVDLGKPTAGRIVFSKVKFHGARCVMYSPGQKRYYPDSKMRLDWSKEEPNRNIWIEVPENI
ncbi:F-box family protein [Striga asiatica]|uniref:F-box family protein n=1 Tax=Striga asiatica TaxID=4170 RepID=A0A5A7QEN8_STRAF|nr:F-box family protein [Striga asiatica]